MSQEALDFIKRLPVQRIETHSFTLPPQPATAQEIRDQLPPEEVKRLAEILGAVYHSDQVKDGSFFDQLKELARLEGRPGSKLEGERQAELDRFEEARFGRSMQLWSMASRAKSSVGQIVKEIGESGEGLLDKARIITLKQTGNILGFLADRAYNRYLDECRKAQPEHEALEERLKKQQAEVDQEKAPELGKTELTVSENWYAPIMKPGEVIHTGVTLADVNEVLKSSKFANRLPVYSFQDLETTFDRVLAAIEAQQFGDQDVKELVGTSIKKMRRSTYLPYSPMTKS